MKEGTRKAFAVALLVGLSGGFGACGRTKPDRLTVGWQAFAQRGEIDILFMIDNSGATFGLQDKLVANFPLLMNVLKGLPHGLPSLHIAVVSSDMGAGPETVIFACRPGGDAGIFRSAPVGACVTTGLDPGEHFIANVNGVTNYDPTQEIADVFGCIARLGVQGCSFEHPLASVIRALGADGKPLPSENEGFLRPNANLAIVVVTNEDDCSAPPDSGLFDPASRLVSDPLGPLASYRCNEFGHLCDGQKPPRTMAGTLTGECHSAEDGTLLKVAEVVQQIKSLKADPNKILAIAIAGPVMPYNIIMTSQAAGNVMEDQPEIAHSCFDNFGFADPAVRMKDWADGFGRNGTFVPNCESTFAQGLQRIAEDIGAKVSAQPCIQGQPVDADLQISGLQPDCLVKNRHTDLQGQVVDTTLPACASGATPPCWRLNPSLARSTCTGGYTLEINLDGNAAPDDLEVWVSCAICDPGKVMLGCQ